MTLTEKLDLLLGERALTRSQLASLSGVPYTTIASLYEKGADNAKRTTLLALAKTLGMDPVSLALAASFTLTYTITLPPHSKVNTIYFATGYFTVLEQLKYGIVTCLIGATVISISVFTWFRVLGYGI